MSGGTGPGNHQAPLLVDLGQTLITPMDEQSVPVSLNASVTSFGLSSLNVSPELEACLDSAQQQAVKKELAVWHAEVDYNIKNRGPTFLGFLKQYGIDESLAYKLMVAIQDEPVSHAEEISRHARPAMVSPCTPSCCNSSRNQVQRALTCRGTWLPSPSGGLKMGRNAACRWGRWRVKREDIVPPLRSHALIAPLTANLNVPCLFPLSCSCSRPTTSSLRLVWSRTVEARSRPSRWVSLSMDTVTSDG